MALIAARQMMSATSVPLVTVVVDGHMLSVHRLQGTTTVFGGGREQKWLLCLLTAQACIVRSVESMFVDTLYGTTLKDLSQHDRVNDYMQYLHSKVKSTPCRLQHPLPIYHKHYQHHKQQSLTYHITKL